MTQTRIITNLDYFLALEKGIRDIMKYFEENWLVHVAEQALKDLGVEPSRDEPEGYYHESEELTRLFRAVRALQDPANYTPRATQAVRALHQVYGSPVFGYKPYNVTALQQDPAKVFMPDAPPTILSAVADPVTAACKEAVELGRWSIRTVMASMPKDLGTNLVAVAVLADRKQKDNPVATTCARETTVLSAAKFMLESCVMKPEVAIDWQVDKDVEMLGREVARLYSEVVAEGGQDMPPVPTPTPDDILETLDDLDDIRRCVNIAIDNGAYYHWAIALGPGDGTSRPTCGPAVPRVVDFYAPRIYTTKEYQQNPDAVLALSTRVDGPVGPLGNGC